MEWKKQLNHGAHGNPSLGTVKDRREYGAWSERLVIAISQGRPNRTASTNDLLRRAERGSHVSNGVQVTRFGSASR